MITQKRIQTCVIAFIGLIIINIFYVSAITGNIGNAKMILYPEVNGWTTTTIEKTILVKNINNVSVNISLKTDTDGGKFLKIIDKEFVLQPGEEKKAGFEVNVKKEGNYQGKINVFFSPVKGKEAGVVLPSTIIVIASKDNGYRDNSNETNNANNSIENPITRYGNSKINPAIIISFISTIILFVVLIFLIYLNSKKKKAEKDGNKKIKESEKENDKKI